MATLNDSLVSSSSRRLPIRMRPDLSARRQRYQGRVYWVVKEPVGLNYFRFEEEEYAILNMLDGESSLDEIVERFEAEFPPQTIRVEELQQFIGMLHKSGLVTTAAPGQGHQLRKRRDEKRRKQVLGTFTNVLAIRFKGIDPERILTRMYPYVRWFFSKPATIINLCLAASALLLVAVQFDVFQSRLPSFDTFFAAQNWLWLGLVLACTKIIHEFGHGLSCKHFGGECHEMGVMLLVLTPCLYCNVSDSWMLPNRWHRAAIGAAGMYVEIVIASICTFLWWFSEPGPLHYTCLNIMFVSSVSTILFNANPLLRYDGYYILSDVLEIPNLRQKASSIVTRKLGKWCLGLEEPVDPFLPQRGQWLFATYTVAAVFYRWFIVISILFFLNKVFEPYGLKRIGQFIALTAVYGLVGVPLWKFYKFLSVPGRLSKVKKKNVYATMAVLGCVLAGVFFVPLPASVICYFDVQPRDAEAVYVKMQGTLAELKVEPGQQVKQNEILAQLANHDVEQRIVQLEGQKKGYEARILGTDVTRTRSRDQVADAAINSLKQQLKSVENQLEDYYEDRDHLTLVAPCDGTIIPPTLTDGSGSDSGALAQWSGTPLDKKNVGALLTPDQRNVFCHVGDPHDLKAQLIVDQADIEFVLTGQRVEMILEQQADRGVIYTGVVADRSPESLKEVPHRLSSHAGGPVPTEPDPSGVMRPLEISYQVSVPVDDKTGTMRVGLTGTAKIHVEPRTIAQRLWRWISRTFSFEL